MDGDDNTEIQRSFHAIHFASFHFDNTEHGDTALIIKVFGRRRNHMRCRRRTDWSGYVSSRWLPLPLLAGHFLCWGTTLETCCRWGACTAFLLEVEALLVLFFWSSRF